MMTNIKWQREMFTNPKLWGKIIAISNEEIVYSADTYEEIIETMKKKGY